MIKITHHDAEAYIAKKAKEILQSKNSCIIAIDGNSAAGKSTLGEKLSVKLDASLFHMDDFFLPPPMKTPERLASPGGNIDSERFNNEIVTGILSEKDFYYGAFSCQNGNVTKKLNIYKPLNIIEGVYSLHPLWRQIIDISVFMTIDSSTQKDRILRRNGPSKLNDYVTKWIPMENMYFEAFDLENKSDIIIL